MPLSLSACHLPSRARQGQLHLALKARASNFSNGSTHRHRAEVDANCDGGFLGGGELTVSAAGGLPAAAITHSNDTVGTVVYMGGAVHHLATPIALGGRRLVFCIFYACDAATDLGTHALN